MGSIPGIFPAGLVGLFHPRSERALSSRGGRGEVGGGDDGVDGLVGEAVPGGEQISRSGTARIWQRAVRVRRPSPAVCHVGRVGVAQSSRPWGCSFVGVCACRCEMCVRVGEEQAEHWGGRARR